MKHLWMIRLGCLRLGCLLIMGLMLPAASVAGDLKLRLELAWGTDGTPPDGKNLKELDTKGREKLRHFRWQNYWVVKSTQIDLDSKASQKVPLDRCQVDLKTTGDGQVEVRLQSINDAKEVKLVKTLHHSLEAFKRGEFLIIAGDDKEKWNDAWFVIIRGEP